MVKGTLTPGKLADFAVLPENPPLTIDPPRRLLSMEVEAVYVGGEQVKQ